tara:strand:+ start:1361 stop:2917 length:1557 start_codon:yes stop_codon:yes gene_type:complete
MPKNREIELKGTIRPEHLDQVNDLPAITKRAVGRARSRRLVTVYFDTPDHDLRRQGLSLRVRKVGRTYMQCVKQTHKGLGGIMVRTEWEGPVPSQDPAISIIEEKKLRQLIRRAGVERLQSVFRTDVRRSSRTLKFDDGSTVSLDIDIGEIVAGDVSESICEFELELESGAPERLFDLASEIGKVVPFRLATESKASRGYALFTQEEPQPRKYVKLNLSKDDTVEQVLTELVQHCLDHLRANEDVVLKTDNAEGVHQMRVALRRLRAALRLFKSSLPGDQYGWAVAEAKWLTAELSAPRAWDVFADEFVAPVAGLCKEDQGVDALWAAVEQARKQSRQRARDAIGMERYTEFLLRLSAWLSGQAWRDQPVTARTTRLLDPIGDHCVKLLRKRDRNVRKQGQDIATLSEDALHELRLAVKRLRYAVDFFEGLYQKKRVNAYRKHLAGFQDTLGYLTDIAAADTLLRELGGVGGDQAPPAWAYAGGLTVGWHRHAAIAAKRHLAKDMAAFLRTEPFWHDA